MVSLTILFSSSIAMPWHILEVLKETDFFSSLRQMNGTGRSFIKNPVSSANLNATIQSVLVEIKNDVSKVIQIFGRKNRQLQKIGQKSNFRQGFHNDMMRRKLLALIFPHIGFTSVPPHNRTHTKWQILIWRSGLTEPYNTALCTLLLNLTSRSETATAVTFK